MRAFDAPSARLRSREQRGRGVRNADKAERDPRTDGLEPRLIVCPINRVESFLKGRKLFFKKVFGGAWGNAPKKCPQRKEIMKTKNENSIRGRLKIECINKQTVQIELDNLSLEDNDLVLIVADKKKVVYASLGALRVKLARDLDLIDESKYNFHC